MRQSVDRPESFTHLNKFTGKEKQILILAMSSPEKIYLDNNSTTAVAPEVAEAMMEVLHRQYGNPSSPYSLGKEAARLVEEARVEVADLIGAETPREVVFTSCATESNLSAFHSVTRLLPDRRHLVVSAVEHSSILEIVKDYEDSGYEVTWLNVDGEGRIDPDEFRNALREGETALAGVMWANNETGVISPIADLAAIAREKGVPFHTDAVQAAGKIPVNFAESGVRLMSLSGHKFHAAKGVGALVISRRLRFHPLFGGSQEEGRRGGTLNVASIVGMGVAARLAREDLEDNEKHMRALRDHFEHGLAKVASEARVLGRQTERLPNTSNVLFPQSDGEGLLLLLDQMGVLVSTGSACTTGSVAPSHVLWSMGLGPEDARRCLRFSLSRYNTREEIDRLLEVLPVAIQKLTSPVKTVS